MENDTQNNEEQFKLLLMTLEEIRHGICLFLLKNLKKPRNILHNIDFILLNS